LRLSDDDTESGVLALAAASSPAAPGRPARVDRIGEAAIELAKLAQLLPAAVVAPLDARSPAAT
jgi:hypothetical protein